MFVGSYNEQKNILEDLDLYINLLNFEVIHFPTINNRTTSFLSQAERPPSLLSQVHVDFGRQLNLNYDNLLLNFSR